MVKPEQFGHHHLVYDFTVPLKNHFLFFKKKQQIFSTENYFMEIREPLSSLLPQSKSILSLVSLPVYQMF